MIKSTSIYGNHMSVVYDTGQVTSMQISSTTTGNPIDIGRPPLKLGVEYLMGEGNEMSWIEKE